MAIALGHLKCLRNTDISEQKINNMMLINNKTFYNFQSIQVILTC